jgi:hypothetical protein
MLSRRRLLASALVTPLGLHSGFQAVEFNGKTWYSNDGSDPDLPVETTQATVALCFRVDALTGQIGWQILGAGMEKNGAAGPNALALSLNQAFDEDGPYFLLEMNNARGLSFASWVFVPDLIDGQWHQLRGAIDGAARTAEWAVGSTALTAYANTSQGVTDASVKWAGRPAFVGGFPNSVGFKGGLAEIFVFAERLYVSRPSVYRGFWDTRLGEPVRNDPSGRNAVLGHVPAFYLSGGAAQITDNGAGAKWSPPLGAKITRRSPFKLAAGTGKTARSDPWNQPAATSMRARRWSCCARPARPYITALR